ncbi:MAG: folylpolyglutamate synthase/dihydrofolate synthase family protein [Candidatus Omnitrophota bacterium]
MSFPETVQYLESFIDYELVPAYPYKQSLKLERIRGFLSLIANPQDSLKCLHIAGTKGKGSTCAFITYILRQSGFKAGLYTSPHLSDFRERIRILSPYPVPRTLYPVFEGMISKQELTGLVKRLKPVIEKYNQKSPYGPLTFFEVYTSLALLYFQEKQVDFVVLETGLGGRLDATNVVDSLVAVIAPISYEHTQKLGNTLREIAGEKTGIIKVRGQGTPRPCSGQAGYGGQLIVISAPQEQEALKVIRDKCKDAGARLYEVGRDILYGKGKYKFITTENRKNSPRRRFSCEKPRTQKFNITGIRGKYSDLKIKLIGEHQRINAAAAIGAVEALSFHGVKVSIEAIRKGLHNTLWPGRCEVVAKNPLVVLDGAQNVASARVLKAAIKENFQYKELILVLGISSDKDIQGVCAELKGLTNTVILTKANNPRATAPKKLACYFTDRDTFVTSCLAQAIKKALALAWGNDLILVTGSLFVVGEARELFCV